MEQLKKLHEMRAFGGARLTDGLSDDCVTSFLESDGKLGHAIDEAYEAHQSGRDEHADLLKLGEEELIKTLQEGYVSFYEAATTNPYVPLAAWGPWIVTSHGAVLHDSGGYGMLGFGHGPRKILDVMSDSHVMANIMTASFTQKRFYDRLAREIGHTRKDGNPYFKFLCMNSGSESVTVAMRIADANAKEMTEAGGKHAGKTVKIISLQGSFHGRTDRPAQASNSTFASYHKHLATFKERDNLRVVKHNDVEDLKAAFAEAEKDNIFYECFLMEPVQGEGAPGIALGREFYDTARELTAAMGTPLIMDSIQAGLRATGCLSFTDYPGFSDCAPPDMETYSKAVNAGQYPLSVLAMRESTTKIYKAGIYGNTMTTNPKALEVGCLVLDSVTPELRRNIRDRGLELLEKLGELKGEFPEAVVSVQGTGLLFAVELTPGLFKVVGFGEVEEYMRKKGIGVIHGGKNALRFTPHFEISSKEVDLIVEQVRDALANGPRHENA
jgi:acetylornithine/succinyldiaminopimelate/putrescine aminotransferase